MLSERRLSAYLFQREVWLHEETHDSPQRIATFTSTFVHMTVCVMFSEKSGFDLLTPTMKIMRTTDTAVTLFTDLYQRSASWMTAKTVGGNWWTYNIPSMNMPDNKIFCERGMGSLQISGIGRIRIMMSVMTWGIALPTLMPNVPCSWQLARTVGSQNPSTGAHVNTLATTYDTSWVSIRVSTITIGLRLQWTSRSLPRLAHGLQLGLVDSRWKAANRTREWSISR